MDRNRVKRLRAVDNQDDWERVLAAAAHRQKIVPDAVLVGGSEALLAADRLYPQENGSSVALQIARQFAEPKPFDFDEGRGLEVYRIRAEAWRTWDAVRMRLARVAAGLLAAYARRG